MSQKINWCCKQAKGIRLQEPSDNLSDSYIKRSQEDLLAMATAPAHWKVITAYYACYDILYALLMKCGIKCKIHDCSISLMQLLNFSEKETLFIEELKDDRINVQYYLKEITLKNENQVKEFVLNTEEKILQITNAQIQQLRDQLEDYSEL